jgi:hypothetical protein
MIEKVDFGDPLGAMTPLADNCQKWCNEQCKKSQTPAIDSDQNTENW